MIGEEINKINQAIALKASSIPCFDGARLYGLAEPILRYRDESNKEQLIPVIVSYNGEDTEVFVDDDYPLGIYHKLISKSYTEAPNNKQFGEQLVEVIQAEMLLICWAFRFKIRSDAETLESFIHSALPGNIKANQSTFNRMTVFSGEFSGTPFNLPEGVILFSMKYRFQSTVDRNCLKIESFCNN